VDGNLASEIAIGCRILANEDLTWASYGHISARTNDGVVLVKGRGPHEEGLEFATASDVVATTLGGELVEAREGISPPGELPIHLNILKSRPDVGAVVHAHPRIVVALSAAGVRLAPIYGSYDPFGALLAARDLVYYPSSLLINTAERGRELAETFASGRACILHGHGLVTVGANVQEAVCAAVTIGELAKTTWLSRVIGPVDVISDNDLKFFSDFVDLPSTRERLAARSDTSDLPMWHYLVKRLQR
jgi:3,4-dihydroxyphthalate decarboxylase